MTDEALCADCARGYHVNHRDDLSLPCTQCSCVWSPAIEEARIAGTPLLSTGQPSTLGTWRDNCAAILGEDNAAVAYFDDKIADQGRDMAVIANESQVMYLIASLLSGEH